MSISHPLFMSNQFLRKGLFGIGLCGFVIMLCLVGLRLAVSWEWLGPLPSTKELTTIRNPLASELYAVDGTLIGKYFVEDRSRLTIDDLNDYYKHALIATEDRRFYQHNGVDRRSLLRVLIKTILLQRSSSGGGSTITQQLAKNLYPRKDYRVLSTLVNKFREMSIAKRMEKTHSKADILLLYSNTVSFGEQAFGLRSASHRFFNKEPQDLELGEAATLVGLLKATSYYNPRNHPDRALKRRNLVLAQMRKYNFISEHAQKDASAAPLLLDYQTPRRSTQPAGYFKQYILQEFRKWSDQVSKPDGSKYDVYRDGLKIYSSLDLELQKQAEDIQRTHMQQLQKVFVRSWQGGKMFGSSTRIIDDQILRHPAYKKLRQSGQTGAEALAAFTKKGPRKLWTWQGGEEREMTRIDSIKHYLSLLHSGIFALDSKTGMIRVWVGGNDFQQFPYDRILEPRQVGSTFKPVVYLSALEADFHPCDYYENELFSYPQYEDWTPKNANNEYGGLLSMAGALAHSVNSVSVQVMFDVGISRVMETANRLGIKRPIDPVPSMVLGTVDVSLFEMVSAYQVFANEGIKHEAFGILRIEDAQGNVLYEADQISGQKVIDRQSVTMLNGMMQVVTLQGTASRIYQDFDIDFPIMGKTGTTQKQSDGWFIGYNKDLTVGAWVGTDDRRIHFRNLATGSGGRTALPLVAQVFEIADAEKKIKHRRFLDNYADLCDLDELLDASHAAEEDFFERIEPEENNHSTSRDRIRIPTRSSRQSEVDRRQELAQIEKYKRKMTRKRKRQLRKLKKKRKRNQRK